MRILHSRSNIINPHQDIKGKTLLFSNVLLFGHKVSQRMARRTFRTRCYFLAPFVYMLSISRILTGRKRKMSTNALIGQHYSPLLLILVFDLINAIIIISIAQRNHYTESSLRPKSVTKSLASARWGGSHPPENFNMAGIFFLKRIQQNLFPDQTDGFMLR